MNSSTLTSKAYPHSELLQQPFALLLITGTLIGLKFPLAKIGGEAGVSPMMWAMFVSLGVCVLLLPVLILNRRLTLPKGRVIRYVIISGLLSFVIPNLLVFSVIPKAGSGFTGLMFALSPVFTLTLAVMFRLKTPRTLGLVGIAVGLMGAVIVSITRGAAPEAPPLMWIIVAITIPFALACGNIYRTIDWPENAQPVELAFWSHAFSVGVFLILSLIVHGSVPIGEFMLSPMAVILQMLAAGVVFPVYFRLQLKGGPVLLSQIGYVAAAVGLISATVFLGEQYQLMTWVGAGVIAVGIAITVYVQVKDAG